MLIRILLKVLTVDLALDSLALNLLIDYTVGCFLALVHHTVYLQFCHGVYHIKQPSMRGSIFLKMCMSTLTKIA